MLLGACARSRTNLLEQEVTKIGTYTENSLRKKLYRRGYHLTKMRDGYGCDGYVIADSNRYIVYGDERCLMSLDDIAEWVEWYDRQQEH